MTQEQIEANRLVAEFMGYTCELGTSYYLYPREYPFVIDGLNPSHTNRRILFIELKYHESWDWQIPAWSKIIKLSQKFAGKEERASRHLRLCDNYESAISNNKVEEGFKIITEAIQWYNNQEKK